MKRLLVILLFLLLLAATFLLGTGLAKPVYIESLVPVVKLQYQTVYVDRPVEVEVPVFVTELKMFESYAELRAWLDGIRPELVAAQQPGTRNCSTSTFP